MFNLKSIQTKQKDPKSNLINQHLLLLIVNYCSIRNSKVHNLI